MIPGTRHYIDYLSSRIQYETWGTGTRVIFAFHGYGESSGSFAFFGEALDPDRCLVAIDLPFHGWTEWREGLDIQPWQLFEIMRLIAAGLSAAAPWSLFGYSMGGRIALRLFQDKPDCFDRLVLAAPDGLSVNPWYWLATATAAGNFLFRRSMRRPGWLFLLLRLCHFLRLANPGIYTFAIHYINDRKVRQELYTRWTSMRLFKPKLPRIAALIRDRQIPVTLVYGKFDRIIHWQRGERFSRRCAGNCRLILEETGHQLLRSQYVAVFRSLLEAHR